MASITAGAVYYFISKQEPSFQARTTIVASQTNPLFRSLGTTLTSPTPLGATAYRSVATSTPVLAIAAETLNEISTNPVSVQELRDYIHVRTETDRDSILIHLQVTHANPIEAARIANAVATALIYWDANRARHSLSAFIETLEAQINVLSTQLAELNPAMEGFEDQRTGLAVLRTQQQTQLGAALAIRSSIVGLLEVLEPANIPLNPVSPKPKRSAVLAFALAAFLTYGLFFLRDALDARFRDSDDLVRTSGLSLLAEFPKTRRKLRRLQRESSNYLRTNLLFATADAHPKVVLVTSAREAEGKSSVALSLAESFTHNGYRTLLVDADLRRPVLAKEYKLDPQLHPSLQDHLENPHQEFEPAQIALDLKHRLDLVPTFEPLSSPTEALSRNFREALDKWRSRYDVIVIDSAPILLVADALTIAPLCTGTILVTNRQTSNKREVRAAAQLLQRLGVRILGAVMTSVIKPRARGYGSGYTHAYVSQDESPQIVVIDPGAALEAQTVIDKQFGNFKDPSKKDALW